MTQPRFPASVTILSAPPSAPPPRQLSTLNVDPGTTESAWLEYDGKVPTKCGIISNDGLLTILNTAQADVLVIEKIAAQGMAVGAETFETVFWTGRFCEAWSRRNLPFDRIKRHAIKMHLCNNMRAKDPNIRQALIDRYGGESRAIGGVKCRHCGGKGWKGPGRPLCPECAGECWQHPPGPLHEITSHNWAALAVAVTWYDLNAARYLKKASIAPGSP